MNERDAQELESAIQSHDEVIRFIKDRRHEQALMLDKVYTELEIIYNAGSVMSGSSLQQRVKNVKAYLNDYMNLNSRRR